MDRRAVLISFLLALACTAAAVLPAPGVATAGARDAFWSPPVRGPVVERFDPPSARWGAGHRGVDYAVDPGTTVRAAGAGTVAFAGTVAGARHVVVVHPGGLRTSYSFLATIGVRRGEPVEAGDVVGTSGGAGGGHDPGVLHFGLRVGSDYVDPLLLFRPVDLAEVVHLAPVEHRPAAWSVAQERRGVLDGLVDLGRAAGSAVAGLGHDALDAADRLRGMLVDVGRSLEPLGRIVATSGLTPEVLGFIRSLPMVEYSPLGFALDVGESMLAWARTLDDCDPDAPAADSTGGSGHRVMVVAGINSATAADGTTNALPVERLGYEPGEAQWFSYAGGGDYSQPDTYIPIEEAARRLAGQLRAMQAAEPGREVDLLAHSQGGVVVMAFLKLEYESGDPSFPPLGTVVTVASPHEGAPAASAARFIASSDAGRAFLESLPDSLVPPPGAASVSGLAEGSDLMDELDRARMPGQVELTTIGAALDGVVPADHVSAGGAAEVIVNPVALNAHSAVLEDPDALRVVRAALEQRPLPCVGFGDALVGAVAPAVITRVERVGGTAVGVAGRVVDALPG